MTHIKNTSVGHFGPCLFPNC